MCRQKNAANNLCVSALVTQVQMREEIARVEAMHFRVRDLP